MAGTTPKTTLVDTNMGLQGFWYFPYQCALYLAVVSYSLEIDMDFNHLHTFLFACITTIVLAELQNPINTNPLLSGWRSYTRAVLHTTLCYHTMVSDIPLL